MNLEKFISKIIYGIFRLTLSVEVNPGRDLGNPKKIIIIRQHNQLGDLLAGVSLFRAIKDTYPGCHITLIVSPSNYPGLVKNKYIDRIFIFDKKKIFTPVYFNEFIEILREGYDVALVPVVVSISFTSNLLARIAKAKIRIGPDKLDGKINESAFFFDRRVTLDWRKYPDSNVSERSLDIVRPFGINTDDYRSEITFDIEDEKIADDFIKELKGKNNCKLIGLHVGAGKVPNMWSLYSYIELIEKLNNTNNVKFYLTGSQLDIEAIIFIKDKLNFFIGLFIEKKIPEVAALISKSDLFISNDTGIMHVSGTTKTSQISLFGPTNPFNWAPIGENKFFIRKSDMIDDITVDEVFKLCEMILLKENQGK